jgi:UDPglucose 6-dehydrogenase
MNEIANLCEVLGADIDAVRIGIGTDSRIGKRFLFAGIGYGGSCFPKDVQALEKSAGDVDYDFKILKAVMEVNESQKVALVPRVKKHFGSLKGKTIALWGLSFKPHTDDIREAPALYNIDEFLKEGARVKAHDPEAMANVRKIYGDKIEFCDGPYQALQGADALFISTEWPEYRTPDFERLSQALPGKVIFDGRNLYDLAAMKELGFTYYSIGRETIYG